MGKVLRIPEWNGNNVPQKQLEEIVLFVASTAGEQPTELVLSEGKWSDLDRIEFDGGYTSTNYQTDTCIVRKEQILKRPTSWSVNVRVPAGSVDQYALITANSENTATISYVNNGALQTVVAYKKRYITETKQVIIPVTPEYVSSGSFVNTDEVPVRQRYVIDANKLPSDFRNTDGTIKPSVKAIVQLNVNGSYYSGWGEHSKCIYSSANTTYIEAGAEVDKLPNALAVRTAGYGAVGIRGDYIARSDLSNPWGVTGNISSAHCQLIVWNDEKYATSIPVSDKGYGGLVKTTLATAIADFTVPTVINFDAVAVTTPLKVVQNVVDSRLSLNQIGMWETTGNLELGFDTAVGDRKIKVELWNETLGGLVAETTRYVARNQSGDSIPFTIGLVEVLNTGHEYSLRIYSADSFSNVVINKCRWDVKLYSPL